MKLPKPPDWLSRCDRCGWPIKDTLADCMEDNCSRRPLPAIQNSEHPKTREYIRALEAENAELKTKALSCKLTHIDLLKYRQIEDENAKLKRLVKHQEKNMYF